MIRIQARLMSIPNNATIMQYLSKSNNAETLRNMQHFLTANKENQ